MTYFLYTILSRIVNLCDFFRRHEATFSCNLWLQRVVVICRLVWSHPRFKINFNLHFMFKPGLDASSSLELLNHLNLVAESGRLVILTIHQPRLEIFHLFHKILFLCDGQVKQLVDSWSSLVWLICSCVIFLLFFGLLVRFYVRGHFSAHLRPLVRLLFARSLLCRRLCDSCVTHVRWWVWTLCQELETPWFWDIDRFTWLTQPWTTFEIST